MVRACKPGPKSYYDDYLSKKKPKMGCKARMVARYMAMQSPATRQMNRSGFKAMNRFAGVMLRRWGIPEPGGFDKNNPHGGVMWGSPQEFRKFPLSGHQLALVLEAAGEGGASESTVILIKKTCSYLHLLKTGIPTQNFTLVSGMYKTLNPKAFKPPSQSLVPDHVPTWEQMVQAQTTPYNPNGSLSFIEHEQGFLGFWDGWVCGNRPNCDLDKIKQDESQYFDMSRQLWSTGLKGGRSKLHLGAAGTRPWRVYRPCMCPENKHISPPEGFEFSFDRYGNTDEDISGLCTNCPLFVGELFMRMQPEPFLCYRKYLTSNRAKKQRSQWSARSIADIPAMVVKWFINQGTCTEENPFSRNSGRRAMAGIMSKTKCPYQEQVHLHGDGEKVWRNSYQPDLPPSGGYTIREQSTCPVIATAALRRFRTLCGRDAPPPPPPPGLDPNGQVLLMLSDNLGFGTQARAIYES